MNENLCFLTCWHFAIGRDHCCGVPGLGVSSSSELKSFFAQQVHRCSGIYREFSLLWLLSKGVLALPCFGRGVERGLVPCFELKDTFRQIPCFSAGASFLLQSCLLCPILKFWRVRIAFLRYTLLDNSWRWTLSFTDFDLVPRALGECDPTFLFFRGIDFFRRHSIFGHATQF